MLSPDCLQDKYGSLLSQLGAHGMETAGLQDPDACYLVLNWENIISLEG